MKRPVKSAIADRLCVSIITTKLATFALFTCYFLKRDIETGVNVVLFSVFDIMDVSFLFAFLILLHTLLQV